MMWNYGMWAGFPWMWIFPFIFLIVMLILLFRGGGMSLCNRHGAGGKKEESARDLLDRRYARGEISQEEYQRIKKDLS